MPLHHAVLHDLVVEQADLDARLAALTARDWARTTPAPGWSVRDQIAHLAFYDEALQLAARDPDAFAVERAKSREAGAAYQTNALMRDQGLDGDVLLDRWRAGRHALHAELADADPDQRVPWYGPTMSLTSAMTARLMETWAHGQDISDALGWEPVATDRLLHVAHLGVATRPFSFRVNRLEDAGAPVHVALQSPSGPTWTWGPAGAADTVRGTALDFCLVTTRRRHLADVGLDVRGDAARTWMLIAQAYAGEPGPGRGPGQFPQSAEGMAS